MGCVGVDSSVDETSEEALENSPADEIQSAANSTMGIESGVQKRTHQNGETQGGAPGSQVDSRRGVLQTGSKPTSPDNPDGQIDKNSIEGGSVELPSQGDGSDQDAVVEGGDVGDGGIEAAANQGAEQTPMLGLPNLFQAVNPWAKDVSALVKHAKSTTITNWLKNAGGWGFGVMKIDFGLTVLDADSATPKKTFIKTNEFYSPDCDHVSIPVPAVGNVEAEQGYGCTGDGDCHLLVVNKAENKLYEMWRADIVNGTFYGGCTAVWDLTKSYPSTLRGEGCTSADAAGLPIAATVFTAQEVKSGVINHAIRFILPNSRIRDNVYVRPATHSTFATSGGVDAPPYGVRFRLRTDFPLSTLPTEGARVIARAIQKYGMILSDGGNIALTGASDRYSPVKWADVGVNSSSLKLLKVTDMEVVDMGAPIQWSGSCVRNP